MNNQSCLKTESGYKVYTFSAESIVSGWDIKIVLVLVRRHSNNILTTLAHAIEYSTILRVGVRMTPRQLELFEI